MVDPADETRSQQNGLVDEGGPGCPGTARSARLRDLFARKEQAEAALLAEVAAWDAGKDWALDGQLSAPAWLAWQTPVTKAAAGRVVADAAFLAGHHDIAALLAAGELSCAHVTAMAKAALHHETEFDLCKESLLGSARDLNPTDFAAVMAAWANAVDDRPPRQPGDRGFRIRKLMDGWGVPDGLIDPELCALFERCLNDLAPPDPLDAPDGPRTASQRGHDALADLCRRHLRGHTGAAPATTADVVVDLPTLIRHRFAEHLLPVNRLPDVWGTSTIDGRPLSATDAERILCDSPFGRLVLDSDGEPMDLGRLVRQYTRRQRHALALRDGGCAFPGCDRPPQWCDAHHLDFWDAHHGDTDLDRGILLCRRHHVLIHNRGWSIDRDARSGHITATAPDGRTFTHDPRTRRLPRTPIDGLEDQWMTTATPAERQPSRC